MNLKELNENYDEYIQTEEYCLEEGLKVFKKSKRLYKFADKIDKKLAKLEKKTNVSPSEVSKLKKISSDLVRLADEYKVIEDAFATKQASKKVSKEKIKSLNRKNEKLLSDMKSAETKSIMKKIGLGSLIVVAAAVLTQLGLDYGVFAKAAGFFVRRETKMLPIPTMGPDKPIIIK